MQFYLLSVVMNLVGGYMLHSDGKPDKGNAFDGVRAFLRVETCRLVVGVMAFVTGLFKLLTVTDGDIPVIGDFGAALVGILVGFSLVFEFYRKHTTLSTKNSELLEKIFLSKKNVVGIAGMCASMVHFVFPRVLFL
jgi:hypothetical protein